MIEKPAVEDEKIITALNKNYSIQADEIEFLPIGNDASAFAYRVGTKKQTSYFLKLKKGISNPAGLYIPRLLRDGGIEQVVAPLFTNAQELRVDMDGFALILYPFIAGKEAMKVGMTSAQWTEFGSILKRIHNTSLPLDISQYVRRETFIPKWSGTTRELHKHIHARDFGDPYQKQLALFWKENKETIRTLVERTEAISRKLQHTSLDFVLCHADIHTANILITMEQDMFVVDWDDTLLAPRERDLLFVVGEETIETREEQLFFKGYGKRKLNQLALAYYRYEWCVQEVGDFGERVFLAEGTGERTKQDSLEGFMKLFSKGDVIEGAFNTSVEI